MDRRGLLRALAASAGLSWLERLDPDELLRIGERLHERAGRALASHASGERRRATIAMAAERIIPASDTPGATDANVAAFIEHMLAEWYDPTDRDRLLAGLAELDARSRARGASDFAALAEHDQIALLTAIDAEAAAFRRRSPAERGGVSEHWFSTFKFLVTWGYCTSEVAMRRTLGEWPPGGRYESCAPYEARGGTGR